MFHRCTALRLALVKHQSSKEFGGSLRMFSSARNGSDHYKTLGVEKDSSQKEIREAYVKLSKQHHPDRGGATEKFAALNEAYKVLSNDDAKKSYDFDQNEMKNGKRVWKYEDVSDYGPARNPPPHGSAESVGYYGFQGARRVSNEIIALICIVVVVISGWSHLAGVRAASRVRDEAFKEETALYLRQAAEAREQYAHLSRQERIDRLKDQYESNTQKLAYSSM